MIIITIRDGDLSQEGLDTIMGVVKTLCTRWEILNGYTGESVASEEVSPMQGELGLEDVSENVS